MNLTKVLFAYLACWALGFTRTASADGPSVSYVYDAYGNCKSITNEVGATSSFEYDAYRRCTSFTEPLTVNGDGTTQSSRTWYWYYDRAIEGVGPRNAMSHTSSEWGLQIEPPFDWTGHSRITRRTHDVNNRLKSETTGLTGTGPNDITEGPDTETHSYTYNQNGEKDTYTDPRQRLTTYSYDWRNRLKTTFEQQGNRLTQFDYDEAGNKTRVTFPDNYFQRWDVFDAFGQAQFYYDERNNKTDLTYQWGNMKQRETVVTHRTSEDAAGVLEDQKTTFAPDKMGRPSSTIFPDGSTELTTYEADQVSTFKNRRDQRKHIYYDARGRASYETWDSDAAPRIDRIWDAANRLTSIWNLYSTIDYGYDAASQIRYEGNTVAGAGTRVQIGYARYPNGEAWVTQHPNSNLGIGRAYTARGQLDHAVVGPATSLDPSLSFPLVVGYTYLADGKVNTQSAGNGVATQFEYNNRGFAESVRHYRASSDQTLARRSYPLRDDRDRIKSWSRGGDQTLNPMENGLGDSYDYDAEGQLWQVNYGSVAVGTRGTTTALSADPEPSNENAAVTLTATVSAPSGGGVPTGTVTFSEGGSALGPGQTLDQMGHASLNVSFAVAGSHPITATYSGDSNFTGSSDLRTHTVNTVIVTKGSTLTSLTAQPTGPVVNDTVTLTATVSVNSGSGTPTGNVSFTINGNPSVTVPLNASTGKAQLVTSFDAAGSYALHASYEGDAHFNGSSDAWTITVGTPAKGSTLTSLAAQPTAPVVNNAVTLTATVSVNSGSGTPTGYVIFTIDGHGIYPVLLDASTGKAQQVTSFDAAGTYQLHASYQGDAHFNGSSDTWPITVDAGVLEMVKKPKFNPAGGIFWPISNAGMTVTLSTDTADASIHWTDDDSDPRTNPSAHVAPSNSVTFTIHRYDIVTYKAFATKDGMTASDVAEASYDANAPTVPASVTGTEHTEVFHYDEMGNRTATNTLSNLGSVIFKQNDKRLNQYGIWPSGLSYDGNGAVLTDGAGTSGVFNALNQPIYVSRNNTYVKFGYDPLGRCVKRWTVNSNDPATNPATYFYYDGWNLIEDSAGGSNIIRLYVHGTRTDEIVADWTPSQGWYYHHYDAQGNCILVTASDASIVEQYSYDAFGKPYFWTAGGMHIDELNAYGNRFLFTGREWMADLQLYDFRNRLYHPELGRFIQPDPKEFEAGDYNLYRYCHNDPINKSDPTGFSPTSEAIFTSAGEVIGFLLSLPVDAAEDLSTAGVGVLANPATTIGMTAAGGLAGRSLDHLINGNPSRNSVNQEGNRSREARANNPNSDISRAVGRFEKQKLGQQMKEYKNLEKTFKDHLKDYGQEAGATKGEVNRIERQLEQYRKILEDRGALSKTNK